MKHGLVTDRYPSFENNAVTDRSFHYEPHMIG